MAKIKYGTSFGINITKESVLKQGFRRKKLLIALYRERDLYLDGARNCLVGIDFIDVIVEEDAV